MLVKTLAILGVSVALFIGSAYGQQAPIRIKDAQPGEIRVLATAAIRVPLDSIVAEASKAIGKPIVVQYGSARGNLKDEALAGQPFEVALLLPDVDEELLKAGKIFAGSREIAQVEVAIGLRGDVPRPDVSTPAKLKDAMLKAKSVKYGPTGAALVTVRKVLSTLDVADKIADSSRKVDPVPLAAGEYELAFYPLSEILVNKNVTNLGLVPAPLQIPAAVTATVGKNANDESAARALVKFLEGPAIDAALAGNGMKKGQKR